MRTNIKATELQQFSYYTGSQISVWFGDIWVDDIMTIRWQYNQEKRPLFGYASQHFDAVARGQVIVQGDFVINFREKGYISYVMQNLPKLYNDFQNENLRQDDKTQWSRIRPIISTHLRNGTFGPSTNDELIALAQSPNFWEDVELYEKAIWGDMDDLNDKRNIDTPDILQHDLTPQGFDILITYGDVSNREPISITDVINSTAKSLNGVHLLGSSQVIQANGEPVQEVYSFMARDIDKRIGTTY